MESTKIIELFIDDLDDTENGIDYISLVSDPAIERNFLKFNKDKGQKVLSDKTKQTIVDYLENNDIGTDRTILKDSNIVSVSRVVDGEKEYEEYKKKKDQFLKRSKIKGKTDEDSIFDTILGDRKRRVRYYYEGPTDTKNRDFCSYMMRQKKNTLFRWEDIQAMTDGEANDEFGYYDIFTHKGSYNCRHFWVKVVYDELDGIKTNPQVKTPSSEAEKVNLPVIPRRQEQGAGLDQIAQEGFSSSCSCGGHTDEKYKGIFKVSNEDKRILMGPAMVPNETIYRYDPEKDEEFYVYFSKDTIRKLAEKYMKDGKLKNIDVEHNNIRVDAYVVESWIIEGNNDKAYNNYSKDEAPEGTWMVSVKINDEKLWEDIKNNPFGVKGFSVEGSFLSKYGKQSKDDYLMEKIKQVLNEI